MEFGVLGICSAALVSIQIGDKDNSKLGSRGEDGKDCKGGFERYHFLRHKNALKPFSGSWPRSPSSNRISRFFVFPSFRKYIWRRNASVPNHYNASKDTPNECYCLLSSSGGGHRTTLPKRTRQPDMCDIKALVRMIRLDCPILV